MKRFGLARLAVVMALVWTGSSLAADPATIHWNGIPTKTIALFYPAQSTYQWLCGSGHAGSSIVNNGGSCLTCHNGASENLE